MRRAAIRLSAVTKTPLDFYLRMPVREFAELNREVAQELDQMKRGIRGR